MSNLDEYIYIYMSILLTNWSSYSMNILSILVQYATWDTWDKQGKFNKTH